MKKIIFCHLNKVNMNYYNHMKHSMGLSVLFFQGGIKAFVHSIYPNVYETSSTDVSKKINNKLSN